MRTVVVALRCIPVLSRARSTPGEVIARLLVVAAAGFACWLLGIVLAGTAQAAESTSEPSSTTRASPEPTSTASPAPEPAETTGSRAQEEPELTHRPREAASTTTATHAPSATSDASTTGAARTVTTVATAPATTADSAAHTDQAQREPSGGASGPLGLATTGVLDTVHDTLDGVSTTVGTTTDVVTRVVDTAGGLIDDATDSAEPVTDGLDSLLPGDAADDPNHDDPGEAPQSQADADAPQRSGTTTRTRQVAVRDRHAGEPRAERVATEQWRGAPAPFTPTIERTPRTLPAVSPTAGESDVPALRPGSDVPTPQGPAGIPVSPASTATHAQDGPGGGRHACVLGTGTAAVPHLESIAPGHAHTGDASSDPALPNASPD